MIIIKLNINNDHFNIIQINFFINDCLNHYDSRKNRLNSPNSQNPD